MSLDPVVLFFVLGLAARLAKSDLRLPEPLYETLSIYLLLAIGLKGGVELARQPLATVLPQAAIAMALSALIPFVLIRCCAVWAAWRPRTRPRSPRTTARCRW
jgi:uncharacterized protein